MAKKSKSNDSEPGLFDNLPTEDPQEQVATIAHRNWRSHLASLRALDAQVTALIDEAVRKVLQSGRRLKPDDIGKVFRTHPQIRAALDRAVEELNADLEAVIEKGSREAWLRANTAADEVVAAMAAGNPALKALLEAGEEKPQNARALRAFHDREMQGLNLSDRVWRTTQGMRLDMERAIEVSLAEGAAATELSKRVRQLLREPNRLYRRVRDKDGNLRLSAAAQKYRPGRGVYRSSYANAMRVARTEVNMAYQTADSERWSRTWWVKGIRVSLSNNHTSPDSKGRPAPLVDICDALAGEYPADFKFTGWHPQCRCFATAITCSYAEIRDYHARKRAGEDMSGYTPPGTVTEPPAQFRAWLADNADRLNHAAQRGTTPYFIANNPKYTGALPTVSQGTGKPVSPTKPKQRTLPESPYDPDNMRAVADAVGVWPGKPMTFEEANELKGNPHYLQGVAYRVNCQTCVLANELRRRGFDIEAMANTEGSPLRKLARHTESAWLDAGGGVPVSNIAGWRKETFVGSDNTVYDKWVRVAKTRKQLVTALETDITEDGRYHVKWVWKKGNTGHIITAERTKGVVSYYDPQNGRKMTSSEFTAYIDKIDISHGLRWLRVDNLRANPKVAGDVLTKPTVKARSGKAAKGGTAGASNARKQRKQGGAGGTVSELIKARNKATTNAERVAIDKEIIARGGFTRNRYHSKAEGSIYATKEIPNRVSKDDQELLKNLQMAKKMADNGFDVYLLDNPHGVKSADFIFAKGGKVWYTEGKLSTGENSLDHNLDKGTTQAERVLIDITGTKDTNYITSILKKGFEDNDNLREVMLLKGHRLIHISELTVQRKDFEQYFKKLWEQKK